jgi:hypothetical protein
MVDKHLLFILGLFFPLPFVYCIAVAWKLAESALNHLAGNDENSFSSVCTVTHSREELMTAGPDNASGLRLDCGWEEPAV